MINAETMKSLLEKEQYMKLARNFRMLCWISGYLDAKGREDESEVVKSIIERQLFELEQTIMQDQNSKGMKKK